MIMTKDQFITFRKEIEAALAPVAEKYDCEVTAGNIKYDDIVTNVILSFCSKRQNGKSADQLNFEKYCAQYGFEPSDYGFTFTEGNKTYSFVGFNPKARKNYCLLRCNGKTFVTSPEGIKHYMENK